MPAGRPDRWENADEILERLRSGEPADDLTEIERELVDRLEREPQLPEPAPRRTRPRLPKRAS